MSKFKTSIPVDIEAIKRALPEGAFIDKVTFNDAEDLVEVHWEHDKFVTPFDHAVPFELANLTDEKLPAGVKLAKQPRVPRQDSEADEAEAQNAENAAAQVPPAPAEPTPPPTETEMQQKLDAGKESATAAPPATSPAKVKRARGNVRTQNKKTGAGKNDQA